MDPWDREWDVVVIGAGMGGSVVGHALAKAGHSVLFLERGHDPVRLTDSPDMVETDPARRIDMGWWPNTVSRRVGGTDESPSIERFYAALGAGEGGSTLLYAAAFERMQAADFASAPQHGQAIPHWPVSFDTFEPYYDAAEKLFQSHRPERRVIPIAQAGKTTPIPDAHELSEWDLALAKQVQANGFTAARLNTAIRYDQKCKECIGVICDRGCKRDARSICLEPAKKLPNVAIVHHCDVRRLEAGASRVEAVVAQVKGVERRFRGRVVVLAAGTFFSPALLLRSRSEQWPRGLANGSDMVGRNLMFHVSDLMVVMAPRRYNQDGLCKKSLAFRDFYEVEGERLGTLQSMGLRASAGLIAQYLKLEMMRFPGGSNRWIQKLANIPARIVSRVMGSAGLFATITEDFPNPNNRVFLNDQEPSGMHFVYDTPDELKERVVKLRKHLKRAMKPWWVLPVTPPGALNFGHASGTLRAGLDPKTSVVDARCRAHEVENLYVADASIFPTSGAANPSLTIAANALRIAPFIDAALRGIDPARSTLDQNLNIVADAPQVAPLVDADPRGLAPSA